MAEYEDVVLSTIRVGGFLDGETDIITFKGKFLIEKKEGEFADYQATFTIYLTDKQTYVVHKKVYRLNLVNDEEIEVEVLFYDSLGELFEDDDIPIMARVELGYDPELS
ncbi:MULTISPECIES: hypothetical protein [unclassified Paenibacillus]|uniref:hypothetical protein n=1 Tax=unclassified Paenibacillus TaxID=185978 RepID=UPI00277F81AC|nr:MULTISPECIES: hypothetical protein [unclassified Paenibacillus]MDQ0896306.1 hypothetical protein [Paenibacillus sp. V4I7]MDQ0913766.1 hypothetical protein [Paenibacillus sp. V4I5]